MGGESMKFEDRAQYSIEHLQAKGPKAIRKASLRRALG
jgi:hypothetical protein